MPRRPPGAYAPGIHRPEAPVEFETLGEFVNAVASGRLARGDVVYVSAALYARLSASERDRLWRQALDARVRLVTDVDVTPPIVVEQGERDD